jgi:hypothetical protein
MSRRSNCLTAAVLALSLFAVPAFAAPEQPRVGGKSFHQGGGGRNVSKPAVGVQRAAPPRAVIQNRAVRVDRGDGRRHTGLARHRGTRYLWGGLPFFFYDGYYHGDCSWLRRKANETGSRYWLTRYRQCRDDD